LYQHLNIYV